ncbi:MAG TPA: ABC transporter permease [Gemmatimonadaceae bacterium]|nr:ABC transporter permease [Gemmatimonadaceae bacterium]
MSLFSDVVERLRALAFRRQDERDLDNELRFHLEMEAEEMRRKGIAPQEIRRRTVLALGGVDRTKEEVRDATGVRWLSDAWDDARFALRVLRQRPTFTVTAVLTLALGIGGTTAVFSAVDAVLIKPLPYGQPGRLVRLYYVDTRRKIDGSFVTPVHYLAYRDGLKSFESLAALNTYGESGGDITGDEGRGARRIHVLYVSRDYFDVLRSPLAAGRPFDAQDEVSGRAIVLSDALWRDRFHRDASAMGRTLTMNGVPYVITGVMQPGFTDPVVIGGAVDAWIPIDLAPGRIPSNVDNHYMTVIGRLRPGVTITAAQAELDALGVRLSAEYPHTKTVGAVLKPLKEDVVGESSRALQLMLAAAFAVLLLVCVNVANLLLVRGSERGREFALRGALGAGETRIVRQLLMESLVLALAGDVAGLVVAQLAMRGIVALGGGSIPRLTALSLDPRILGFSILISSVCAIACGLVPAMRAGRSDPNETLRGGGGESRSSTDGRSHARLRSLLVVAQVALAFVLVAGAGLLIASVRRLRELDLGIRAENVLTFELHLPEARYDSTARARTYEEVAHRLEAIPGVSAAGGVSKLPATGQYNIWGAEALSGPLAGTKSADVPAENRVVSGDYFKAVGIQIVSGRAFNAGDVPSAPRRVIVSQSLAKRIYPGVDPIGQTISAGDATCLIVGVANDVSVDAEGRAEDFVYHPHAQFAGDRNWALAQVVAATTSPEAIEADVRRVVTATDPELVMHHPMSLAEAIGRGEGQRTFTLRLLASFAAMSLGLAALGLFGVLSYGVKLRRREIAIRVALGAEARAIRRMVLRQGMSMTGIGMVIGLVGALAASRLMASLLFRVSPVDPRILASAACCLFVVGGLAAYLPASRASSVDPRTALQ